MRKPKLDRTDLKILEKLQDDGRITNLDLAKHAGISAPPCLRRVRALEESGVIEGYHADINPQSLGYEITVYVLVKLTSQNDTQVRQFEEFIADQPMVRECHLLTGDMDFLIRVTAKNWENYQNYLSNHLSQHELVSAVKTSPLVRTSKHKHGVPVDL
tara:strand:- start:513 stop:986 length:474 start_codon:yes stop_codon:yes gene_type:complete